MNFSVLEQFRIIPIISFYNSFIDISISNAVLIISLGLAFFFFIYYLAVTKDNKITPNNYQLIIENLYLVIANMLKVNIDKKGEKYLTFLLTIFLFVLISNVIGLIPYSFTITSHIIVTFFLGLSIFIGVNIIGVATHKLKFLRLFYPAGTSFYLGLLLVPIEIISHIFKPISLSVRLFANMMSGHTLLKVIGGFGWKMLMAGGIFILFHYIPLLILFLLYGLELGVACIQAYVFVTLIVIYLKDSINLH